MKNFIDLDLS